MKRHLLLAAGALSLTAAAWLSPHATFAPGPLLGPLAPIAAQVQWVRGRAARQAGDQGRAFLLMESAVRLEPRSTTAWIALANQLGLQLASAESGRSPEERAEWLHAACTALREGQSIARQPGGLALHRGLLLMSHAETDPTIEWKGGTSGLWSDAADAFEQARMLAGNGDARATAAAARDYARTQASNPVKSTRHETRPSGLPG